MLGMPYYSAVLGRSSTRCRDQQGCRSSRPSDPVASRGRRALRASSSRGRTSGKSAARLRSPPGQAGGRPSLTLVRSGCSKQGRSSNDRSKAPHRQSRAECASRGSPFPSTSSNSAGPTLLTPSHLARSRLAHPERRLNNTAIADLRKLDRGGHGAAVPGEWRKQSPWPCLTALTSPMKSMSTGKPSSPRGRLFLYLIRYRLGIWSVEGVANRSRCVLSVFALAYAWFLEVHSHPYRKTCPSSWLNMRIAGSRRSMGCRPTEREAADASIVIVVARRGYLQNHLRLGIDQVGSAIHHRADGACREFWRCPTRPTAPVMWLIMAKFPRIVAFDHVRKAIGFRIGTPTERKEFRTSRRVRPKPVRGTSHDLAGRPIEPLRRHRCRTVERFSSMLVFSHRAESPSQGIRLRLVNQVRSVSTRSCSIAATCWPSTLDMPAGAPPRPFPGDPRGDCPLAGPGQSPGLT